MSDIIFDYNNVAERVVNALRTEFPTDTIDTREGYHGRVHVTLVSRRFNGWSEAQKQAFIGDLLRDKLGPDAQAVSLALVYGTDEL
jgi:stress-induced morphogen